MFCPRCGSQNPETTKFCRQCGLSLQQLSGYVASGGTGALTPPPLSAPPAHGMPPQQKMALSIMLFVLSPAICGVLGKITGLGLFRGLAGLCAVAMPLAIMWSVFHFRSQIREQKRLQQTPPPDPRPAFPAQQRYQPPLGPAPPTNPLGTSPGSITEEETRHLPDRS